MTFIEKKESFIEEYVQAKLQNKISRWVDNFQDNYEDSILEEGIDYDDYLDEIIAEGEKRSSQGPQLFPPAQIEDLDNYLKKVKYGKKNLKYDDLLSGFEVEKVFPNYTYLKNENDVDTLETELETLAELLTRQGAQGVSQLQQVMMKVSSDIANAPDSEEMKKITMSIDDMVDKYENIDEILAEDRKTMYAFWEKVAKKWTPLEEAWKTFKKELEGTDYWKENEQEIPDLPEYVRLINPIRIHLDKEELRMIKLMELLGGEKKLFTEVESAKGAEKWDVGAGADKPFLTQIARPGPESQQQERINKPVAGEKVTISDAPKSKLDSDDIFGLTGSDWKNKLDTINNPRGTMSEKSLTNLDLLTKDQMLLDPILWYVIESQMLEGVSIPIALEEKTYFEERVNDFLEVFEQKANDSELQNAKKIWNQVLETAGDIDGDVYLPFTDWVVEYKVDNDLTQAEYSELNKEAVTFFEFLSEVLIESKGQYMVSQEPSDVKYTGTKGLSTGAPPIGAGKTNIPNTGMRTPRTQPHRPSIKRTFTEETFNTAITNLTGAMDEYYFGPLTSDMFVEKEKPDFAEDLHNYNFRNLKIMFSEERVVKDEIEMLDGYAEHITITDLKELIGFYKAAAEGKEESWPSYTQALENIVDTLEDILPSEFDNDVQMWGAKKAYTTLKRNFPEADSTKTKFMGVSLDDSIKLEGIDPINRLRKLLQSKGMVQILRKEQRFREISGNALSNLIKEFLEISDPTRKNASYPINEAVMNAYDIIRKQAGLKLYYGTLLVDDINDMDVLINKIYNENKIEINTMEIESIVKSDNSIQNISNQFGISGELIYKIKGLCR